MSCGVPVGAGVNMTGGCSEGMATKVRVRSASGVALADGVGMKGVGVRGMGSGSSFGVLEGSSTSSVGSAVEEGGFSLERINNDSTTNNKIRTTTSTRPMMRPSIRCLFQIRSRPIHPGDA